MSVITSDEILSALLKRQKEEQERFNALVKSVTETVRSALNDLSLETVVEKMYQSSSKNYVISLNVNLKQSILQASLEV